ncbi:hypothetical protein ACETU7_16680 [Rhodococcus sp. 3Y1]
MREAARSAEEGLLDVGLNPAEQMSIDVDRISGVRFGNVRFSRGGFGDLVDPL